MQHDAEVNYVRTFKKEESFDWFRNSLSLDCSVCVCSLSCNKDYLYYCKNLIPTTGRLDLLTEIAPMCNASELIILARQAFDHRRKDLAWLAWQKANSVFCGDDYYYLDQCVRNFLCFCCRKQSRLQKMYYLSTEVMRRYICQKMFFYDTNLLLKFMQTPYWLCSMGRAKDAPSYVVCTKDGNDFFLVLPLIFSKPCHVQLTWIERRCILKVYLKK